MQWNRHPIKWRDFLVVDPVPFSPVYNARKFSALLDTLSANISTNSFLSDVHIKEDLGATGVGGLSLWGRV
jgi:hypothetical protein